MINKTNTGEHAIIGEYYSFAHFDVLEPSPFLYAKKPWVPNWLWRLVASPNQLAIFAEELKGAAQAAIKSLGETVKNDG